MPVRDTKTGKYTSKSRAKKDPVGTVIETDLRITDKLAEEISTIISAHEDLVDLDTHPAIVKAVLLEYKKMKRKRKQGS